MELRIKELLQYCYVFFIATILASCSGGSNNKEQATEPVADKEKLMIFSAASLTDVLGEIVDSFEVKYNAEVQTNMASSGTLARQIAQGSETDVYISASKKWANYVDSIGSILPGSKTEVAKNDLVLIAPLESSLAVEVIDSTLDLMPMIGEGRLSMGDPSHVPAGKYAKQSLDYYGWYSAVEPKMLPAKDVRSALMVVELGEAPLGIVYRTDALKSKKVKILATFPESSHKPIVYVSGVCKDKPLAKSFYEFLNSEDMVPIWAKYGFKK